LILNVSAKPDKTALAQFCQKVIKRCIKAVHMVILSPVSGVDVASAFVRRCAFFFKTRALHHAYNPVAWFLMARLDSSVLAVIAPLRPAAQGNIHDQNWRIARELRAT
jgi:hypothetical protein